MDDHAPPDQTELGQLYGGWIKRTALMLKARMPWADLDELLQWGAIGMLEAMNRFDRTHGVTFEAFAARCHDRRAAPRREPAPRRERARCRCRR
jgi:DNA-directed RNA polymerase specialized sigma subunit